MLAAVLASSPVAPVAAQQALIFNELATTTLPSVVDTPVFFRLLRVSVPAGQSTTYAAPHGMVYQLSGLLTVAAGNQTKTLQAGDGMYVGAGVTTTFQAMGAEPAVFLQFLLVPAADLDQEVAVQPATASELFRSPAPLPGLNPGPYTFNLTSIVFPAKFDVSLNPTHYRSGGALYYVVSGTGEFVSGGCSERRPPSSIQYEPYGLVHSWGNPEEPLLNPVVANISPVGAMPVIFGTPSVPVARDGQSLATQCAATQMLFQAVHGEQAATRWVQEHNAELARMGG
jgi:quercetin dioxygenase-like cupin family protein